MPLRTTGTNVLKDRKNLTKRKDASNNVRVDASDNVRIRELTNPIYFGAAGWWDFSNQDYLILDTVGSDTIQQANDISGNGNHWVQNTKANQPAWTLDGGIKGAEFDGANAWMQVASPAVSGMEHLLIIIIHNSAGPGANPHYFLSEANSDFAIKVTGANLPFVEYNIGGAQTHQASIPTTGSRFMLSLMIDGSRVEFYKDGTLDNSKVQAGDLATSGGAWFLGATDAGITTVDMFDGHIMEMVIIPRGDKISPKELFFLHKLFADKWSITL